MSEHLQILSILKTMKLHRYQRNDDFDTKIQSRQIAYEKTANNAYGFSHPDH